MKKFDNFISHMKVLKKAENENLENEFIMSGVINKFFIQFELAWKVMKELLRYEGNSVAATGSPREIIKSAYVYYDFMDEKIWLEMLKYRNSMAHEYDEEAAKRLVKDVIEKYIPEFDKFEMKIENRYGTVLEKI